MHIETKRFLYNVLIDNVCDKNGCYGVTGARKVGKTILFLQLDEYYSDKSLYFDCTSLLTDETFDFKDYYEKAIGQGIKIIFLDEVCKINDYYLADFVSQTKLYSSKLCIMITGSVSRIVQKRLNEIGRGCGYELPPFMYIEKICWENGYNEINLGAIKKFTSDENLKNYLKNQMMSSKELLAYMKGVVEDTLSSYKERTYLESAFDMDNDKLINSLKYIALCQYVYKKENGEYVSIPAIEKNIREKIFDDYKSARTKWNLSNKDIENVINILLGCNLAKKAGARRGNLSNAELADDKVPEIIFEYPWYCSVCFNSEVQNSEALLNIWIEYAILLRAVYIYSYVGKYRNNDNIEIDVIYLAENYCGIEVKNRPYSNNTDVYITKEKNAADSLGLDSFIISSSEGLFANDKIIVCLELEYIDNLRKGLVYSENTIEDLFKKYI